MSAAATWQPRTARAVPGRLQPGRPEPGVHRPSRVGAGRPRLELVPTGHEARLGRRRGSPAPLRITRFGRLLLTSVGLAVVVALSSLVTGWAGALAVDHTVTVAAGQTLSGIAATELPQLPVPEGVARIQLANALSTTHIHAGQELRIPAVR